MILPRAIGRFLEKRSLILALGLIAIATIRIAATYREFSFTIDEPGHFACGLQYLSKHVYRYLTEQPPLSRVAIALPPYLARVRPLGEENYNLEGRDVILRSGNPDRTLALMRLGILPFFWLACGVVYLWCRRQFAGPVAPLAVALFTMLPPVLAHAGLACTDMALAACLGAAFLSLILWAESPTWKRGALLGVAAALAVLSKFTALLYLPAAATLALLFYLAAERPGPRKLLARVRKRAATFAFAVLVGAVLLWAGYWFSFGKVPAWNIRLPAPEFFDGLLVAQAHNRGGHPGYLLGNYSLTGWWYYFPIALAVKTPIVFLVLLALGTYTCCRRFSLSACRLPLAFCIGILLPAMAGNVDIGVRHILPVYIGLSIVGALGLDILARVPQHWLGQAAAIVLLLWMAIAGAVCHPDYLSYFNEFAGREPARILVDSNLDWGQDTKRLGRRLRQLGVQEASVMLIEPLTLPLPTEDAIRRFYGLPRIKPVDVSAPGEGWTVLSPTVVKTLGLAFKPWWERMPPTEKVGALWLYWIPHRTVQPLSSGAARVAPYIVVWNGNRAARNADYSLNQPGNPAAGGSAITVYLTGQGAVDPPVPAGLPAPAQPLSRVTAKVTAAIDGQPADVLFAGLAPGLVGTGQVNVAIPARLSQGEHKLVIAIGGVNTNKVEISTK